MPKLPMVRTLSSALCRISFESYRCFVNLGIHRMQRRSQLRRRLHLKVTPRRWSKHIELDLVTSIDPIGEVQVNGKGTGGYSLSVLTFLAFICFYWNVILPLLLCCFKFTTARGQPNGVEAPSEVAQSWPQVCPIQVVKQPSGNPWIW